MNEKDDAVIIDNMTMSDTTEVTLRRSCRFDTPKKAGWYYGRYRSAPTSFKPFPIPVSDYMGAFVVEFVGKPNTVVTDLEIIDWFGPVPECEAFP